VEASQDGNVMNQSLQIPAGGVALDADLAVPGPPRGVALFAHGSGSSRRSPRNRYVAGELQASGLATVMADLLTPGESELDARTGRLRFELNQKAMRELTGEARLELIAGASHLFSEPGALEQVARLARDWFTGHLV
jgi:hypothetical protein